MPGTDIILRLSSNIVREAMDFVPHYSLKSCLKSIKDIVAACVGYFVQGRLFYEAVLQCRNICVHFAS